MKSRNNKGFTLVELLATLAILSIVITIVITVALNIVNSSKDNSYKVTINNIENEAGNYVVENSERLQWNDYSDNIQYQCITVKNLIDKGFFNGDVLDSHVSKNQKVKSNDYILLLRNKDNKTVNTSRLLYGNNEDILNLQNGYCVNNASANINIIDVPIGKVINNYCREKEVTIKYKLINNNDNISNYKYSYIKDNESKITDGFIKSMMETKVVFKENGYITASVDHVDKGNVKSNGLDIVGIDSTGPEIKVEDGYEGGTFRQTVTIPIVVSDSESGVNKDKILSKDSIQVTIGNTPIDKNKFSLSGNGTNYNLTINDLENEGLVIIKVLANAVEDNLKNQNGYTEIETNVIFSNKYTITYYVGNGSKTPGFIKYGSQACKYNQSCELTPWSNYNKDFRNKENGWVFAHWSDKDPKDTSVNRMKKSYGDNEKFTYNLIEDLNLYAVGKRTFKFYSGTNGAALSVPDGGTFIQYWNPYDLDDAALYSSIDVPTATAISGWDFYGYRGNDIASDDVAIKNGKTKYEPAPNELTVLNFRSIYNRTLTIKYDKNHSDATGSTANTTVYQYFNSGVNGKGSNVNNPSLTVASSGFERTGYQVSQWNTKSDGTGTNYSSGDSYPGWKPEVDSTSLTITLYAQWDVKTYKVKYDANGGSGAPSSQTKTYGETLTLRTKKPTRSNYTFTGWNTAKGGGGTSYAAGGKYKKNKTVTLYAQWKSNSSASSNGPAPNSVELCGACTDTSQCKSTDRAPAICKDRGCYDTKTAKYYACCGLKGNGGTALPKCD